jgi:hypothetical protein
MTKTSLHGLEKFSSSVAKTTQPMLEKTLSDTNREKTLEVIGNILSDTPGDRYIGLIPTAQENFWRKILSGYAEIDSAFEVLRDIPLYLSRFPLKHLQISKTRYIKYHIGNYLNEVYILRERLRSYQKTITRMYKADSRLSDMAMYVEKLEVLVSGFDDVVTLRGKHVHQERYDDEDFERLGLYETLGDIVNPVLSEIYPLALREYRKKWLKTMSGNNNRIQEILDSYFEILYGIIFDKNGNWIEPVKSNRA